MQRLSLVVALEIDTRVIGKEGGLPWRLPADMKRFVKLTTGHPVIMGRKTWESISTKFRPLKDRTNIVVTRQKGYVAEGARVVTSLEEAYAVAMTSPGAEEVFGIGGAELYQQMIKDASRLYLTLVRGEIQGDAYFPLYDEFVNIVERGPYFEGSPSFFFLTLER